ncbi:MAG: hypothetical protein ACREBG_02570 [Pyrinomonadaceae bacterium]
MEEHGLELAKAFAMGAATDFIAGKLLIAKRLFAEAENVPRSQWRNFVKAALYEFGMAMHTPMDGQSPAHRPWQVYSLSGNVARGVAEAVVHSAIESRPPTSAEMSAMRQQIQSALGQVVSKGFYQMATTPRKK